MAQATTMKPNIPDQLENRVALAIDYAVRHLNRSGEFFLAELLSRCEIEWKLPYAHQGDALPSFNMALPETPATYLTFLPDEFDFIDGETVLAKPTEDLGMGLAIAMMSAMRRRLKPGVSSEMLERRVA